MTVTDATLTADSVAGGLTIASTAGKTVTVTVPTVDGVLNVSGVAGDSNLSVATDADSKVEVASEITVDTVLNGTVEFTSTTTIKAGVTLTINGTVTGLNKLAGEAGSDGVTGSRVLFGRNAKIGDTSITNFMYKGGTNTAEAQWMPGLGFTYNGSNFENDFGTIYQAGDTVAATLDSGNIYA